MATSTSIRTLKMTAAVALAAFLGACAGMPPELQQATKNLYDYVNPQNSLLDPSQVGRFDKSKPWGTSKPVQWPILDQLDMIDEPNERWTTATDPLPTDLVVEQKEYVVGEGDIINLSVYELVAPGLPFTEQKQVNELGDVTIQNLGQLHVGGLTPTEIEKLIGDKAVELGFLRARTPTNPGPQVTVQLYQSRARVFSLLGQVGAPGTYVINGSNFRLLDALALGRDIAGGSQPGMDYLYVIRPAKSAGVIPATRPAATPTGPATNPLNTIDSLRPGAAAPAPLPAAAAAPMIPAAAPSDQPVLIRSMPQVVTLADVPALPGPLAQLDAAISGGAAPAPSPAPAAATPPPTAAPGAPGTGSADPGQAIGGAGSRPGMIFVNGQWIDAGPGVPSGMTEAQAQAAASGMTLPRVIRIPINKLKEGEPAYNIVIQPGDVINVPNIEPGEFYLLGHVNRPGVYSMTGRKVTLKQAVAASGGLDALAIPRRCDLIRRIGNTEVTVQVDLQRIFDGEQPDIFLKSNDLVNVGTDMLAPFLAVTRNAYRASYGWGYTYDRNFYNQPVIQAQSQ